MRPANLMSLTHTQIDYVIWTGDIVAHDIWNTSRASNLAVIDYTTKTLAKYLDPSGVPVFPSLGNHEGEPVDRWAGASACAPFFQSKDHYH